MDPIKVNSDILTYYMNRIQSFLTSPKTSQVFPGLSKGVEDILVKLPGQDELKLQGFDDDFKALVSVIKSEIERKKGEYRLICDFQKLSCGTRSLIYRKSMIPIAFKQPQPLRKPNSMNMTNRQSPALSSDLITQSFKLRCLNATLKFVKDESRLSLKYPDMAMDQAKHVLNMFEHNNSDGDLGLGYKTLYAPLWEAMRKFGDKYKFTLKYTDPIDRNMKCLVLDKIPIVQASKNNENQDENKLNLITLPEDNQKTSKISLMDISDQSFGENMIGENIKIDLDQNKQILIAQPEDMEENISKIFLMDISDQSIDENIIEKTITKVNRDEKQLKISKKPTKLDKKIVPIQKNIIKTDQGQKQMEISKLPAPLENNRVLLQKNIIKTDQGEKQMAISKKPKESENNNVLIHKNIIKTDQHEKQIEIFKKPINIEKISSPIHKNTIKIDQEIMKKQTKSKPKLIEIIKLLGDGFMKETFKRIYDFIMDETAASMTCYNMSPEKSQVLIHWNQIVKMDNYKLVLSADCLLVMDRLSRCYEKTDFSIQISEGRKKSKMDLKRDVTLNKVPFGEKTNVSQNHISAVPNNESLGRKASRLKSRRDASAKRDPSAKRDTSAKRKTSAKRDALAKRDPSAKGDPSSKASARQASAANPSKANKIKMKLLEGLNQPVTSDKAMRMMLNMGWEGGALGARGDGIVEPIRPSLDTGKRYGLGAPIEEKPKKTPPVSFSIPSRNLVKTIDPQTITQKYHNECLKLILDLLYSMSNTKEINFPETNIKKEWNYVKNVVILLNKGVEISGSKTRLEILDQIMGAMSETDWILTAGLKTDGTIVIKKSILPLFPAELKLYCEIAALTESNIFKDGTFKDIYKGLRRNATKEVKKDIVKKNSSTELNTRSGSKDHNKETHKIKPNIPNNVGNWKLINEKHSNDVKKTTELTDDFKNNVLANVLLFCQTNIDHKIIKFGYNLVENQRIYIKECIEKANMSSSFMERTLETRFYEQIIAAMDGFKISVVFSSECNITLEKLYPSYDMSVKNINNNVTIHYFDEDIDTDGETSYLYKQF